MTPDWWELVPGWLERYMNMAHDAQEARLGRGLPMLPFPKVHFRLTGKKAGWCSYMRREIALNPAMDQDQAFETLAHELAHYFAYYWDRHAGHGPTFRAWMMRLGHKPSRCHNYTNVIATGRGDWYHCPACPLEMKTIKDGTQRYCRKCNRMNRRLGRPLLHLRPGRSTPESKLAMAMVPHVAAESPASMVSIGDDETPGMAIRGLVLELGILRDGGMGSSSAAKKLRRALRKLGHQGGTRG